MKRRLAFVALIVLVAVVGLVVAAFMIPPGVGKEIATTLAVQMGQDVQVDALHWKTWPGIRFSGREIRVANPADGGGAPPLVTVESFVLDS